MLGRHTVSDESETRRRARDVVCRGDGDSVQQTCLNLGLGAASASPTDSFFRQSAQPHPIAFSANRNLRILTYTPYAERNSSSPAMASATTQVHLAPAAGFCVKSSAHNTVSVPTKDPAVPITIPAGLKIFVNIAWDANVPPPPDGSDAAIERAMADNTPVEADQALQWFVPVIVSEPRFDTDKGASCPSITSYGFLCISHNSGQALGRV